MSIDVGAGVAALTSSPAFGVGLTLGAFALAQWAWQRAGRPAVLHPVLLTIVVIVGALRALGVSYTEYMVGGQLIGFLLGPATVALALPLYQELRAVRTAGVMIGVSLLVGSISAIAAGYWLTSLVGGTETLALSMAPKSATTPVAIVLATSIGGIPALSAVFAVSAGVLGAVVGPTVLSILRIRDPRARGLALGVASHGIGTARALEEQSTAGAFSGLAMAVNALATSLLLPLVLAVLS